MEDMRNGMRKCSTRKSLRVGEIVEVAWRFTFRCRLPAQKRIMLRNPGTWSWILKPEVNMNNNQHNNQPNLTIVRPNYKNFETRRAKLFSALASCELRPRPQRATGRSSVQPRPLRLHRRRATRCCRRCDLPSGWFVSGSSPLLLPIYNTYPPRIKPNIMSL